MKLVDLSVKRPVGIIIIVIAVMLMGAVSLNGLALDLLPDIDFPVAAIMTSYQGAGPEEVENLITKPLEGALATLEGLENLQSISVSNQSVIYMEFNFGTDLDFALLDIRDKVDLIKGMLPEDADSPTVLKFDPNSFPIIQLSVSGFMDESQLTDFAEDLIQPQLERIPGVAQVSLSGGKVREIQVEVDPVRMEGYGLTLNQIVQAIGGENLSASVGRLTRGSQDMQLRVTGEFTNTEDIKKINISLPGGGWVKLEEIANVSDTFKEQNSYAYVNGEPAVSLSISKSSDGNTVSVSDDVNKQIKRLQNQLPNGVSLTVVYDTAEFITGSISSVVRNMLLGGSFAVLVLYLFLGNIRSTLIIATALPFAVISTFTMIYFSGNSLNILTLGGLALGIGLMVDSAIIILENIYSYRQRGFSRLEAAKKGASEIGGAVIASALTTVAVFAPIVFTQGLASEIFTPLALTVTFSLLGSVAVALTLIPMMASRLIRDQDINMERRKYKFLTNLVLNTIEKLQKTYGRILKWALSHRKTVVTATMVLIIASLALVPMVGMEFIPSFDQGELAVEVQLPAGTQLEQTAEVLMDLGNYLSTTPGVENVFINVGAGGLGGDPGFNSSGNTGSIYARLVPLDQRELSTDEVLKKMIAYGESIPDVDLQASSVQSGGFSGSPISVEITGDELDVLKDISQEVRGIVASVEGTLNVEDSFSDTRPELQVIINRDIAATYGLNFNQIMQTVRTGFNGQTASLMKINGQEIDIRVQLSENRRQDINHLGQLTIRTPMGANIPLYEVAQFKEVDGQGTINRKNQERGANVTADIIGADLASISQSIEKEVQNIVLPEGYSINMGGQQKEMSDAFIDLALALLLAIFLVYAVMAVQFESFLYPFIIMFSIPATIIGIIVGFVITGRTLSVPSFIGIIMLSGIVVNNAIVLVDYINILRKRGIERDEAIISAGLQRLRPILMTTLTTVLAMAPLAIGIGEGSEMQAPLATVIVFGLSFSTLITLIFVPVIYIIMDNFSTKMKAISGGHSKLWFWSRSKSSGVEPKERSI